MAMTFFNQPLALRFSLKQCRPEMHLILFGREKDGNEAAL
jgi:hypothetical protein